MAGISQFDISAFIAERANDFTGREWVFAEIDRWLADPNGSRIFFLGGGPGSGKSTVAARLVQLARGEVPVGAWPHLAQAGLAYHHFCQAQYNAAIEPLGFVKSLSLALADRYPAFALALTQTGERQPEIHVKQSVGRATGSEITAVKIGTLEVGGLVPRRAFAHLVAEPLEVLVKSGEPGTILILVDAMDEALTFDEDDNIVTLLVAVTDDPRDLPKQVRFLVTGRLDPRVADLIGKPTLDLIDDAPDSQHDVQGYAERRLASVLAEPAARQRLAEDIAEKGAGNFLYARYVLDNLAHHPADPAMLTLPAGLDDVYARFLKREVGRQGRTWRVYRPLMEALVVARDSGLTREQLAGIMNERPSTVEELLEPCMQYLGGAFPDGPFRIYHQSFRDFLLVSEEYKIYPAEAHQAIAEFFLAEYTKAWPACRDDYAVRHAATHLVETFKKATRRSQRQKLANDIVGLFTDFDYLDTRVGRFGANDLADDIREARDLLSTEEPTFGNVLSELHQALSNDMLSWVHNLQDWNQRLHPNLLAQHVYYLAKRLSWSQLDSSAASHLRKLGQPYLELMWYHPHNCAHGASITSDGQLAVFALTDDTVRVFEMKRGQEVHVLRGHKDWVTGVATTHNNRHIISGSKDRTLKVWNTVSGQETTTLVGHTDFVTGIAVTKDDQFIASASYDRSIKIWDLQKGRLVRTLTGHQDRVYNVTLTLDDSLLISASYDHTLRLWSFPAGQLIRTFAGHTGAVMGVAITSDGRHIVSASQDGTLRWWSLASGEMVRVRDAHGRGVSDVAAVPNGDLMISCGPYDMAVKVWSMTTGRELATLAPLFNTLWAVAFAPDGATFVVGGAHGVGCFCYVDPTNKAEG